MTCSAVGIPTPYSASRRPSPVSSRTALGQDSDIDANVELLDRSCALVDVHVLDASVEQRQCEGHAPDAAANDGGPHTPLEKHGRPAQMQRGTGFRTNPETRRGPRPTVTEGWVLLPGCYQNTLSRRIQEDIQLSRIAFVC